MTTPKDKPPLKLILVIVGSLAALSLCLVVAGKLLGPGREIPQSESISPGGEKLHEKHAARPEKDKLTVGLLYWSMSIPGQVAMRKGLEKEAEKINENRLAKGMEPLDFVSLVAGDGAQGIENQISQMNRLIDAKVDLIIVQPTDIAALSAPLRKANRENIPVVAYDQHIIGGRLEAFVTSDNYQAGSLGGEYVAAAFPKDKKLAIAMVEYPHVSSTVARVNGFIDALEVNEQAYEIVKTYTAVEPVSGAAAGAAILKDFPEKGSVDVVFTVNDGGGLAVVKALVEAERTEIFHATVDGDPDSVKNIRLGQITKIDSAQFCGELGAESMRTAYQVLRGQDVAPEILVPVFPITPETIDKYKGWGSPLPSPFEKPWRSQDPLWTAKVKQLPATGKPQL